FQHVPVADGALVDRVVGAAVPVIVVANGAGRRGPGAGQGGGGGEQDDAEADPGGRDGHGEKGARATRTTSAPHLSKPSGRWQVLRSPARAPPGPPAGPATTLDAASRADAEWPPAMSTNPAAASADPRPHVVIV